MFGFRKKTATAPVPNKVIVVDPRMEVTLSVDYVGPDGIGGSYTVRYQMHVLPEVGGTIYIHSNEAHRMNSSGHARVGKIYPCMLDNGYIHYMVNCIMTSYDRDL